MTAPGSTTAPAFGGETILIATPNRALRSRIGEGLRKRTHVEEAGSGAEALSMLEQRSARFVLLDRLLPDLNSEELIGVVERQFPRTDVVLLDSVSGEIEVPEYLRGQAAYYWFRELNSTLARLRPPLASIHAIPRDAISEKNPAVDHETGEVHERRPSPAMLLPGMVGESPAMLELARMVRCVAPYATAVLISGETGAGKELVAEAIHKLSPRAERAFVTINCAAIPESLMEAELFGYTRGAFTGAVQSRLGKIHAAQGGTIFFDEIGELPLASQAKLLRFLECGEVQRLGTSDVFRLDVRVIAATNSDLERRVEQRLFRDDLFYRLSVFPIETPPLRARPGDIALLARYFLEQFGGAEAPRLNADGEAKLAAHPWPGNVRELRNVMERAIVLAAGNGSITPNQIRLHRAFGSAWSKPHPPRSAPDAQLENS
jgi:transcriptional regulator with GAF, ATPase, and Fis domain